MGLAWRLPKESTYVDFFQFLPRAKIHAEENGQQGEIDSIENKMNSTPAEASVHDIREFIIKKEEDKDLKMKDLQIVFKQLFEQHGEFSALSTEDSIDPKLLKSLEKLYDVRNLLLNRLGEDGGR
jgi:hypothetical protein